jgi:hypothetical protein
MVVIKTSKLTPLFQIALVCVLWLVAVFALPHGASHSSRSSTQPRSMAIPVSRFVFADLDGDKQPDLALVETQSQHSSRTNYSIRLKFSQGTESAIPVDGPIGGLRLAARDVNGDDNLDLVVTSNLDSGFVEVLLNDGSGNFSVASPGSYSDVEPEDGGNLEAQASAHSDLATLVSLRSSHEQGAAQVRHASLSYSRNFRCSGNASPAVLEHALFRQGRSPPLFISLS